jgi:hypothetical protein
MPNAPALRALLALHQVDSQISRLDSQKRLLPVSLRRIRERLDRQREVLAAKKDQHKHLRVDSHGNESLLRGVEEEIAKLQTQLNTASSNKEYTTLQHEIAGKRADASRIEDQVLTALADLEALEAAMKEAHKAIQEIQREYDDEAGKVQTAAARLDRDIAKLQGQREAATKGVDRALLDEYRRIAGRKGSSALATVVGDTCQGCFMQLPPQLAYTIGAGTSILHCPSCSRILYLP